MGSTPVDGQNELARCWRSYHGSCMSEVGVRVGGFR